MRLSKSSETITSAHTKTPPDNRHQQTAPANHVEVSTACMGRIAWVPYFDGSFGLELFRSPLAAHAAQCNQERSNAEVRKLMMNYILKLCVLYGDVKENEMNK
jgi:hypothetical protein